MKKEEFSIFLEETCQFLKEKLSRVGSPQKTFTPKFMAYSPEVFQESKDLKKIKGVYARLMERNKVIDRLFKEGSSNIEINSILSPGKEEEADYFQVGEIMFQSSSKMSGSIKFINKFVHETLVKEFLSCSYELSVKGNKYEITEMTPDWGNGIMVIAFSIFSFEKDPETFILERGLNQKKKTQKR